MFPMVIHRFTYEGLAKNSTTTNTQHPIVADNLSLMLPEGKYWISGFATTTNKNTGYALTIRKVISKESMRFKESAPFLFDFEYSIN
jgi:hypothetical protein